MKSFKMARTVGRMASAWLALAAGIACAQAYPARPVRIIVPYGVGTATDTAARALAQKLSEVWGKGVSVEAIPGAGGVVGSTTLAKATPDGYTLGVVAGAHAVNAALYHNLPYDSLKDFKPVMNIGFTPLMIVCNPQLPVHDLKDLIAQAKAAPNKFSYGSGGTGSAPHLAMEYFVDMAGIRMTHAPYKNLGQLGSDLMSGQIDLSMTAVSTLLSNVKAGKVRALGVTGAKRSPLLPETPAIAEVVPGYEVKVWIGMIAPAGTPDAITKKIYEDGAAALRSPEVTKILLNQAIETEPQPAGPFWEHVTDEVARWTRIVNKAGVKVE
ncbi:MAG TPA: tripartite tricarboxylate transporter substrate binding protein [Burkholderiales bacterium]|jgi:tripartite-type tricarboxylate transporter receptor subunit TctC|nr:tripartite tricarboxylate transporter substrate binding protein [Burkholderiales bacterium]